MKKSWIQSRNEKLQVEIAKMRQEFTSEELKKCMEDPELFKFGFFSYKRGLLQRGLDILADEENEHIWSESSVVEKEEAKTT